MASRNFFAELKRRNVVRMAGLYLVGAWLLVQVAGTVLPMFGAPDWLPRSVVILLALVAPQRRDFARNRISSRADLQLGLRDDARRIETRR